MGLARAVVAESEVETGGPRVFCIPAVALHTSAGAGGLVTTVSSWDGACWSERGLLRATFPLAPSAASYDKRIILWDLGVPNHDYEFQAR